MNERTINNDVTMGGASATLLAGRYRVVKQLGQGGMGSVWLAEDTKLDNHQVAIKMLPSILVNNKRAYAQVKQEALVSLKLSHSNIATVRAFEEEGGNPFLVMDYIDGQSLDDYLAEKGTLTEEETIRLLKPVAAALDYAHGQGVVHRDVKPGNIMIAKGGTPFVLDFGIAREIQETMTRVTGKLSSGTLLYMSPEQLNGEAPKPAQDIYSFAAVVYECLKGEPPFSRGQVEFQILNRNPEPLPSGSALAKTILRGLAKRPEARMASCTAVLEGGGARKTLLAVTPSDLGRKSRARGWVVVVALLALVALVTAGGVWWLAQRNAELERQQEMEIARLLEQERRAAEEKRQKDESDRKEEMMRVALANAEKRLAAEESERKARVETARTKIAEEKRKAEEARIAAEKAEREARAEALKAEAGESRDSEPKPGDTKTIALPGGATMEMVWCPPGSFLMGSPPNEEKRDNDETQHSVTLTEGFWMGKYEVTQRQWESVMGENPSYFKGANRPVEKVSWDDCQKFIRKINAAGGVSVSLPTEAQWEYACRAGTKTSLPNGKELRILGTHNGPALDEIAWYGGNSSVGFELSNGYDCSTWEEKQYSGSKAGTHPVGQKKPNAWGLYDMIGNVREWCADWYGDYVVDATDPTGPALGTYRVYRGGSWINPARSCRSAYRYWCYPNHCSFGFGLRLVCSVQALARAEALKAETGESRDSEPKPGDTKVVMLPSKAENGLLRTQPSAISGHQDYGIVRAVKSAWAQPSSFADRQHYRYEACLVPYIMENGRKRYVDVDAKCGEPSIAVRSYQDSDRIVVVVGSNACQSGLVLVTLKTKDGTRSGRKWLNSEDFSSHSSSREIEVELR